MGILASALFADRQAFKRSVILVKVSVAKKA